MRLDKEELTAYGKTYIRWHLSWDSANSKKTISFFGLKKALRIRDALEKGEINKEDPLENIRMQIDRLLTKEKE